MELVIIWDKAPRTVSLEHPLLFHMFWLGMLTYHSGVKKYHVLITVTLHCPFRYLPGMTFTGHPSLDFSKEKLPHLFISVSKIEIFSTISVSSPAFSISMIRNLGVLIESFLCLLLQWNLPLGSVDSTTLESMCFCPLWRPLSGSGLRYLLCCSVLTTFSAFRLTFSCPFSI